MNDKIRKLIADCTPAKLLDMEMSPLMDKIDHPDRIYMFAGAGEEHYRLLTYLSLGLKDALIIEYGTYRGLSAVCLAANPLNKVWTVDIIKPEDDKRIIGKIQNLDCTVHQEFINASGANLIFVDTEHDGIFEWSIMKELEMDNYKGAVIFDDIHLETKEHSSAMPDFWNSITQEKQDITHLGHWSGTGIVYFE